MPKIFEASFISDGKFLKAGDLISDDLIKPFMLKYARKSAPVPDEEVRYQITDTSVPLAPHQRRHTAQREMMEMASAVHQQDQLEQELDQERQREDERLKPSIEDAQERHQAETERRKKELEVNAQRADELREDIIREKEDRLKEEGFYNVEESNEEVPVGTSVQASDNGESEPEAEPDSKGAAKPWMQAESKPKKPSKLFAKRDGEFVLSSSVTLIAGESLYRLRPRTFGSPAKYIRHGEVKQIK